MYVGRPFVPSTSFLVEYVPARSESGDIHIDRYTVGKGFVNVDGGGDPRPDDQFPYLIQAKSPRSAITCSHV